MNVKTSKMQRSTSFDHTYSSNLKRVGKFEAPKSKPIPFRFGSNKTVDRPNIIKRTVSNIFVAASLRARKAENPQINQQIISLNSNDELFSPIEDSNSHNVNDLISPNEPSLLQILPTSGSNTETRARRRLYAGSYKVKKLFF